MIKNEQGQIRSGWLILISFIIMYLFQGIFVLPFINLIPMNSDVVNSIFDSSSILLLVQGSGTIGGIIAVLLTWKIINKEKIINLGFKKSYLDLFFGLFLGALSITLIFFYLLITNQIELVNTFSTPNFSMFTLYYLVLFIFVGFFEEIYFRGYVMRTMATRNNPKWTLYVVSAVFFSLVHGTNPNVTLFGLVNILLVGLLFAYMFDKTGKLWLPIGYHITWNYFQGNIFGFPVSGLPPNSIYEIAYLRGEDLMTGGAFGLEGGILATLAIAMGFLSVNLYCRALPLVFPDKKEYAK